MAKSTVAELEQRIVVLEDALRLALGRLDIIELSCDVFDKATCDIAGSLEGMKAQIDTQFAEIVEAIKTHKPAAKPSREFGAGRKFEFTGTFDEAHAFAKANCARMPAVCKTLVDGEYVFHIFFNK